MLRTQCEEWRVAHVGPIETGRLSTEECNAAVRSVYAWSAPILEAAGAVVSLSDERQSPKEWMSPELQKLLQLGLMHGSPSHPSDWERWNDFLIANAQGRPSRGCLPGR